MRKIIAALVIGLAISAHAQDFTNVSVSATYTNVEAFIADPAIRVDGVVQKVLDAHFDGKGWTGRLLLQRSDGKERYVTGSFGQAGLMKAANNTAGIVMDANASNVIKKLDKIVEKALRRDANKQIDSGQVN